MKIFFTTCAAALIAASAAQAQNLRTVRDKTPAGDTAAMAAEPRKPAQTLSAFREIRTQVPADHVAGFIEIEKAKPRPIVQQARADQEVLRPGKVSIFRAGVSGGNPKPVAAAADVTPPAATPPGGNPQPGAIPSAAPQFAAPPFGVPPQPGATPNAPPPPGGAQASAQPPKPPQPLR